MTTIVNLWGGPGSGKSSVAAGLFSLMKFEGFQVELVTEAAKEIVWDKQTHLLNEQMYISAMQNRRLARLVGQVDYVITDSPLLMGIAYFTKPYEKDYFAPYLYEVWSEYENVNIFIDRKKEYNPKGRVQTEAQAKEVDSVCVDILNKYHQDWSTVPGTIDAPEQILRRHNKQWK